MRVITIARLAAAIATVVMALVPVRPVRAQDYVARAHLRWRTLETEHFRVHFPEELRDWSHDVASRLEAVYDAVTPLVGSAPRPKVNFVIDEPVDISNGGAFGSLEAPAIFVFPTPPDPTSGIGDNRGWGELLSVHEYAHIAHLTVPSRNRRDRLLWKIIPLGPGPIARKAPRWIIEGYATYLEGKLTGHGRPHGAARAAILREWAVEGMLPSYAQLNATESFYAGNMAYLAGSAFLEWLGERAGEDSYAKVWRRLSARRRRGFLDAFAGVYGDSPAALYARFTAELTVKAMAAEQILGADSTADGETVQRLAWYTGEPAISPDGSRLAIVLRARRAASRVVIWKTEPDTLTDKERKARAQLLERDPLDVLPIQPYPRPRRAVATLSPAGVYAYGEPRFLRDSAHVLVSRPVPRFDGTVRHDLFEWTPRTGRVRRITRGAGVRGADPSPDGSRAVAVRCVAGSCSLVRVDLRTGALRTLLPADARLTYHRPRYAPDGQTVAVGVQRDGRWSVVLTDDAGAAPRPVVNDTIERYAPSFTRDGRALIVVSEAGGVPNLERLSLAAEGGGPPMRLTRASGMVSGPEAGDPRGFVYFLSLHARGLDLNRVRSDSGDLAVSLGDSLVPAAPRARVAAPRFDARPMEPERPYGLGPRQHELFPAGSIGADEGYLRLVLAGSDPVGKLSFVIEGAAGERDDWRGAAAAGVYRGIRPALEARLFHATHRPREAVDRVTAADRLDIAYTGASARASLPWTTSGGRFSLGAGASTGRVRVTSEELSSGFLAVARKEASSRHLAFTRASATLAQARSVWRFEQSLTVRAAAGETQSATWSRSLFDLSYSASRASLGVRLDATYGLTSGAPEFERFAVGGVEPPIVDEDILTQRVPIPALPVAFLGGRTVALYRATLLGGAGMHPYFLGVTTNDRFRTPYRLIGAEQSFSLRAFPIARIPAFRVTAGSAYTLDRPDRHRTRYYFSLAFAP